MISAAREYAAALHRSFTASFQLLEQPKAARRAVAILLAIQTALLAYSAYVHSPTLNEPGHLVAGLSYWKFGRFDVYNVNPPLVKLVAALPVMAVGYEEDWSGFYTGLGARPEFSMGEDFVAANGERSFFLFMIARWACIPFSWLGGIVCYLWARDLFGRPSGVIACAIWCFEPNILAHASLITSDAAGTALGLAACYTFWRWLKEPTWSQAILTGIVLGLAELTKTTLLLFYPLWPLIWLVYRWPERHTMAWRDWLSEAIMLGMRMAIGLYILNLGFGFEGSLKPLSEFQFVSNLFTGETTEVKDQGAPNPQSTNRNWRSTNRFAGTWLEFTPVPFPANYLVGIDLQQRDFENYPRQSYLRGQWRDRGWWYYYLYAVAIKVPLGLWLLGGLVAIARLREAPSVATRDEFVLLLPAILIFIVVSSKTGFNEHMRYVLPAFPYFFIWASGGLTSLQRGYNMARPRWRIAFVPLFSTNLIAICWLVTSSLSVYPHSLSYFNESIGGPLNGSEHLLASSIDWGQDLTYLMQWYDEQGKHLPLYIAYCGGLDPSDLGLSYSAPRVVEGEERFSERWYAISVNNLRGMRRVVPDGIAGKTFIEQEMIERFSGREVWHRAGMSIYVFRLSAGNQP